ncbi:ABC transporter substrate-binding protein, partial [Chloroflexota bacterium]
APKTVKLGFLATLSGPVAPWGLPGLYGAEMWVDDFNDAGGMQIGGDTYIIELIPYDDEFTASKAVTGAKKLVLEDKVNFLLQMISPPSHAAAPFLTEEKMLSSVMIASDTRPDFPYMVNLVETYPLNMLALYDYVAKKYPEAKTVAMSNPDDKSCRIAACYTRAGWEAAGIEVVYDEFYDPETLDYTPIATAMLASGADIMCWDSAYPNAGLALTEEAYYQGWDGPIASCTFDLYRDAIDIVGKEYLEGYTYVYPDFDYSSHILTPEFNAFYDKYNELYPGTWSCVSWEYADVIKIWARYAERADSIDPLTVLAAMKADPNPVHPFGPGRWLGTEIMGIDNSLVGAWPVGEIQDGNSVIVEMVDLADWYYNNIDLAVKHLEMEGYLWYQQ